MSRTFTKKFRDDIKETAHITGNPYSDEMMSESEFYLLDEVWRYAWDENVGTIHPRPITDRAITTWRNKHPNRMLVHYMQPHYPFVPSQIGDGISIKSFGKEGAANSVWELLAHGKYSRDEIWSAYQENWHCLV
ncbi:hypothetical protein [Haladaptatus sp. NG-SE-30]